MKEFKKVNKIFIKSNNTTSKIFNRYLYCLIPFTLLIIVYNLLWGSDIKIAFLIKSISISFITCISTQYIFNLFKKEKKTSKLILEEKILTISIILGLFSMNSSTITIIISSLVSIIMKNILKNITISSAAYGILIITIVPYIINDLNTPLTNLKELSYIGKYNIILKPYGDILNYLVGVSNYLSPLLAILSFIYLFYKKSIKYNIVFSYILTFITTMLLFGLINNMNIWYLFFQLTTGNILFLSVFCLPDYQNTPITREGQLIYGITLGILTCILRFIVPELSVIIPIIIGPIILTRLINLISHKLKYNKKIYYKIISILIFLIILTNIAINIIF